eukprot:s246_g7.t1
MWSTGSLRLFISTIPCVSCIGEELTDEVPEEWVRRVQEVCPCAPRGAVVASLRETRDESRTINQLLDGPQPVPTKRPRLETPSQGHGGPASTSVPCAKTTEKTPAGKALPGWGLLRAPTARDMTLGCLVLRPGSPLQPPSFEYLVVLDFEWTADTADNRKAVKPISEITQFPSVLVRLAGRKTAIVDEFNAYVRPTLNPILPQFSIEPRLQKSGWLKSHGLVSDDGRRQGHWAICTWTDADIGAQLVRELSFKDLHSRKPVSHCAPTCGRVKAAGMIQHLVLAMHTPGRVDILLHDHAFGIAFSGKTTKTQGHSIKVVGERGLLCPKQAAQKMLYKMVDAPGSCLRLQSWEICDSVLTRLICEESAREGAMLAAHCYRNVPLAGKSASSRGNSLQKIAFEVDRIRHPHSVLRSSVGELDLIGTRKLQRRGFARGSADWLRDSVRVEFKSSKLRWSEWHSGWLEVPLPGCFDQWVDLKVMFQRHYRCEPKGGLQKCVESLGLTFEGRAHDGLIDCRNTAAIVLHMAQGSMLYGAFTFRRATRGLDRDGNVFGSRAHRAAQQSRRAEGNKPCWKLCLESVLAALPGYQDGGVPGALAHAARLAEGSGGQSGLKQALRIERCFISFETYKADRRLRFVSRAAMRISVLSSKASHCSGAYAPHVKGQLDLQKQKGKGPAHQWMLTAVVLAGCWLHMDPETNFCCRAAGSRLAVTLDPRSFRCRVPRGVRERRRQQDRSQDDGEARRLTAQITKAGSASELLALLEKPAKDAALFNSFHISAAMTKLARFKKRRQVGQADASSPVWATLSVRVSDMLEQDLLPPREAANVFYAAGELYQEMGKHMTKVLPLLCDSVHKKAAGMAEQALSNCLLAVVKLEDASPDVLTVVSALAMHIPAKVGAMTTQGMSNCLLAAAKLQDSSPEVLDIVPALAKFLPHKVGDMIPQALSNSLWAAAKLQD